MLTICTIRQVISVALTNPGIAAALGIPVGTPPLTIRRLHDGAGGTPRELAFSSPPTDRYRDQATIKGMA